MEPYEVGDIVLYRANKDTQKHILILDVIVRKNFYDVYNILELETGRMHMGSIFYSIDQQYMSKVA